MCCCRFGGRQRRMKFGSRLCGLCCVAELDKGEARARALTLLLLRLNSSALHAAKCSRRAFEKVSASKFLNSSVWLRGLHS